MLPNVASSRAGIESTPVADRRQLVQDAAVDQRERPRRPATSSRRAAASAGEPARSAAARLHPDGVARPSAGDSSAKSSLRDVDELWVAQLGRVPYAEALALQEELRALRQADAIPDTLLVLEHPPVYTRGRRTEPADLPMGDDWYRRAGIEVARRRPRRTRDLPRARPAGGLPDHAHRAACARSCTRWRRRWSPRWPTRASRPRRATTPLTGVWAGDAKIGSIGVHVSRHVTTHGLAVNVDNDLQPFEWIVPCGIDHARMTSVALRDRPRPARLPCFRKRLAYRFAEAFGRRQRLVTPGERLLAARGATADSLAGVSTPLASQPRRRQGPRADGRRRAPLPRPQAGVVQAARAGRPEVPPAAQHDRGPGPAHRLRRRPPARTSASAGSAAPPPS